MIKVNEIISAMLARLNVSEPLLEDAVEFDSPAFDIRTRIRLLLIPSATETVAEADDSLVDSWESLNGLRAYRKNDSLLLSLPADCRRLLFLRMEGWSAPVDRFMEIDSAAAGLRRLWDRQSPLRHRRNPGVAVGRSANPRNTLVAEIFGSFDGAAVIDGGYLPNPRIILDDDEEYLVMPPGLLPALLDNLYNILTEL